jgi:hypothetical protein
MLKGEGVPSRKLDIKGCKWLCLISNAILYHIFFRRVCQVASLYKSVPGVTFIAKLTYRGHYMLPCIIIHVTTNTQFLCDHAWWNLAYLPNSS